MSRAAAFAALHTGPGPFLLPNAWDVTSALLLAEAGFPAVGTTSLGVTAAAGLPDGAGLGAEPSVALAAALAPRLAVPLTVDLEGGYAEDPGAVAALAVHLAGLDVAGINLEDGRPGGELRTPEAHAAVVAAVVAAAPGLFVNARTDTCWQRPGGGAARLEETVRRLSRYAEAGASGVFVPGLTDLAALEHVAASVPLPLNVLWRPEVPLARLAAAGVARVSTGSALYRHAVAAATTAAVAARSGSGSVPDQVTYDHLQQLLGGPPG